ncbi:helix-turn-helix domain-containing protein [Dactylosporangium sp. CA-233914]|uniref:helix-turn-helix domain-containing protein n=1 Tax=Dactylosporangium sp. CA-233914 TaxID=3239934 RepID=UPI003D939E9B
MSAQTLLAAQPRAVREIVGRLLREFREAKRISRADAALHLGGSESKISRIELGDVKVKEDDLGRLLTLYGVRPLAEWRALLDLVRRDNEPQWWHEYRDVLTDWLCSYLLLESAAETIRTYEVQFIPGLLQTRAYAEAVTRLRFGNEAEVQRRVNVRMRRQRMLHQPGSPRLWAVVDEAALRKQVGGPQIMREQLESLIRAGRRRDALIQVLPFGAGGRAGAGNSFSILRLRSQHLLDVVYLEQIDSALFFADQGQSDPYLEEMTRIGVAAKPPEETEAFIKTILRERDSAP